MYDKTTVTSIISCVPTPGTFDYDFHFYVSPPFDEANITTVTDNRNRASNFNDEMSDGMVLVRTI